MVGRKFIVVYPLYTIGQADCASGCAVSGYRFYAILCWDELPPVGIDHLYDPGRSWV